MDDQRSVYRLPTVFTEGDISLDGRTWIITPGSPVYFLCLQEITPGYDMSIRLGGLGGPTEFTLFPGQYFEWDCPPMTMGFTGDLYVPLGPAPPFRLRLIVDQTGAMSTGNAT